MDWSGPNSHKTDLEYINHICTFTEETEWYAMFAKHTSEEMMLWSRPSLFGGSFNLKWVLSIAEARNSSDHQNIQIHHDRKHSFGLEKGGLHQTKLTMKAALKRKLLNNNQIYHKPMINWAVFWLGYCKKSNISKCPKFLLAQ